MENGNRPARSDTGMVLTGIVLGILFAALLFRDITKRKRTEEELRKPDITERKHKDRALEESEERFRSLAESATDAVVCCTGKQNTIYSWNRAAESIFGFPKEAIIGKPIAMIMPERFRDAHEQGLRRLVTTSESKLAGQIRDAHEQGLRRLVTTSESKLAGQIIELTGLRKDGSEFPLELSFSAWKMEGESYFTAFIRDITERKQTEEIIRHKAYHDPLTDLPNRALFDDFLNAEIADAHRYRERFAVIFFDLDRFKSINDSLGHTVGDDLLRAVAVRMKRVMRGGETVARLGGDEFLVLVKHVTTDEDAATVAERIRETIEKPWTVGLNLIRVTASLGVALYPDDAQDARGLVMNADTAMYVAKAKGRNHYQNYKNIAPADLKAVRKGERRIA